MLLILTASQAASIMTTTYKSLLSEICAVMMNFKRINDVELGDGLYSLAFYTRKNTEGVDTEYYCLRDDKGNDYSLSVKQIAGLRVAEKATVTAKWFDEFKDDASCSVFQVKAKELMSQDVDLSNIKFKVVSQLQIRNDQVTKKDVPVYQDFCYEGITEYRTKLRALIVGKGKDYWNHPEYKSGIRDLRENLHKTDLKEGKGIDAHIVRLPIFQIIG